MPQIPSKALAQQAVAPVGGVQTFVPQATLPAGTVGGGPASGVDVAVEVGAGVVPLLPESLPHAIGERLANSIAAASPRIMVAFFITFSCPSRDSVRNARRRDLAVADDEIRLRRRL